MTSWDNGTTTVGYGYDDSGNRTQVGDQTYTYDARDELTSGAGSTYSYTARGTLASESGAVNEKSTSDAFGQVITQGSQTYSYDALGRMVTATGVTGLSYTSTDNTLAADGAATYTRDPDGGLIGVASGSTKTYAWTDQHTDVVGEFTADGATLTGSRTYDPLGNVTASAGMLGNLGYQSGWTDPASGRVNMDTRWYNPAVGQFTSRDTASVSPVPDAAAANPFAYVSDNPLGDTDPSGQCGLFSISCHLKAAAKAVVHVAKVVAKAVVKVVKAAVHLVVSAYHAVVKEAKKVFHKATQVYNKAKSTAKRVVKATVHTVSTASRAIADAAAKAKREAAAAAARAKQKAIDTANAVKDAAANVAHTATQFVQHPQYALTTAYHDAKAVASAAVSFTEHHAASIASFVVGGAVFLGCEALTAGIGTIGCGAISGAIGAAAGYLVGAAQGGGFSWGGLGKAALVGGIAGALGGGIADAFGGTIASGLLDEGASQLARVGAGALDGAATGALAGGAGGGAAGALDYGLDCGSDCSVGGLAHATAGGAAGGAVTGGVFGAAGGAIGATGCNSFNPATPVLMANGTTKPIKDVKLGDKVESTDPTTGVTTSEPVTILHDDQDTDLTDLTVKADGHSTTTIHTTTAHPFWDATTRQWTNAGDLHSGDSLASLNGHTVQVVAVHSWTGQHDMRNLTVNLIHTYYVIAGNTPVLVHNCGKDIYDNQDRGKHLEEARNTSRGVSGAEPLDGQAALDNSVEYTPEGPGQAPRRLGVANGEIAVLDRTQQVSCGCSVNDGYNNIWHGHVRSWDQLNPRMQSVLQKAKLVDRKGRPLG